MKLYHGTRASVVPEILADGIKPRGKQKGNWLHSIESNKNCVYLSTGYAIYFAGNAVKDKEDLAVVEIDTERLHLMDLLPDEDFLEQATRSGTGPAPVNRLKSMQARTRWYRTRLTGFQQYWVDSVKGMGTCCHLGRIPPQAITRVAYLNYDTYLKLIWHGMDPMITIMNYKLVGMRYRNYLAWLFGDELEDDSNQWEGTSEEMRLMLDKASVRHVPRDGVTVVDVRDMVRAA